jgi:hypothetical protein
VKPARHGWSNKQLQAKEEMMNRPAEKTQTPETFLVLVTNGQGDGRGQQFVAKGPRHPPKK